MDLQHRIDIMVRLGEYMQNDNEIFRSIKQKAQAENPWFRQEFIDLAVQNICDNFLKKDKLEEWTKNYNLKKDNRSKNVGIVMAGNIPLVGFHDLLSVFISGHNAVIKPSSKDEVLIKHLVQKMIEWDDTISQKISFAFQLKGCDAYIATGSNNSARYFEYYFGKYASIIRRNRTSAAVIDNTESKQELEKLADDILMYFGLGCRNVTKLYVPQEYNFLPLLDALKKYDYFLDFHKYKHNYDYHFALLIMNSKFYMNNGSVLLTENESSFSPVSQVNYEYYSNRDSLDERLKSDDDIQCIVGHNFLNFGLSQSPQLTDYADGIDTMKFLSNL
jgi:hypothetical protein